MAITRRLASADEATRLTRLISAGYFPSELPPPFSAERLANSATNLRRIWGEREIGHYQSQPEAFNVPRAGRVRRRLAIVNPVNQLRVSGLVSRHWNDIQERLGRSQISEFHPRLQFAPGQRAISGIDFDRVQRRKVEILARYGRYVQADIARFFPSVPVNSIAWALLGRDWVLRNQDRDAFSSTFASRLVESIAACQDGQRTGLPIGPDTSRIFSELVVTELELIVQRAIPDFSERAVRYVDDMFIGVRESESAEAVLSRVSAALYEYDLELNDEKTALHGLGIRVEPDWLLFFQQFRFSEESARQRQELDSFFGQSIALADQHPRKEVLLYAVKVAARFDVSEENFDHLARWFLYIARRSPSCLSFVAERLAFLHGSGQRGPLEEIREFIRQQIELHGRAAHISEVCWLLFWSRETGTALRASRLTDIVRLRSSVCALLVLDLIQRRLVTGAIDIEYWRSFANDAGLQSEMWLLSYEATKQGLWPARVPMAYLREHQFFGDLHRADVEFYDSGAVARRFGMQRLYSHGALTMPQLYD